MVEELEDLIDEAAAVPFSKKVMVDPEEVNSILTEMRNGLPEEIKQANLPSSMWTFGGGTVLMHKFNHRFSKDIDIFFRNSDNSSVGFFL